MSLARAEDLAKRLLGLEWGQLTPLERQVIEDLLRRAQVSRDVNLELERDLTFGERASDAIAAFGGSWTFIGLFATVLLGWVVLNVLVLVPPRRAFDPYPFIFLNLILSMIAAIQAPIIMMSQNRQAARDRREAANDYAVNLKAELEIRMLQEKLDQLTDEVRRLRVPPAGGAAS